MSDNIEILNIIQALVFEQPSGFYSKTVQYGDPNGGEYTQLENWSINGLLVGCDLKDKRLKKLKEYDGGCFGPLNTPVQNFNFVEISNIDFAQSDYWGTVPYTINFISYPFDNVINANQRVIETQNQDGSNIIENSVSAKGILTSGTSPDKTSAINNAKAFVDGKMIKPSGNYFLLSSSESVNRTTAEVSASQVWKKGENGFDPNVFHKKTETISKSASERTVYSYQGRIEAGRTAGISGAMSEYKNFKNSLINIISESVTEDIYAGVLDYNISSYFQTGAVATGDPAIEERIVITFSDSANSAIASASIQGQLEKKNCNGDIDSEIDSIASGDFNFGLINQIAAPFKSLVKCGDFNNKSYNNTISKNPSEGINTYSAEFDNRDYIDDVLCTLNIDKNWGIPLISVIEGIEEYICQDLEINTRTNVSCSISTENPANLTGKANEYLSLFTDGKTEVVVEEIINGNKSDSKTSSYYDDNSVFTLNI